MYHTFLQKNANQPRRSRFFTYHFNGVGISHGHELDGSIADVLGPTLARGVAHDEGHKVVAVREHRAVGGGDLEEPPAGRVVHPT